MGLILACFNIQWQEIPAVAQKILDWSALKATFTFNGNIMIRTLVFISSFAIFTNLSSAMGTTLLAENGLLLRVVDICLFVLQGLGSSTQTMTRNFKGKDANEQLKPLLKITLLTSLLLAFSFALVSVLFPQTIFGLLTNHAEIVSAQYTGGNRSLMSLKHRKIVPNTVVYPDLLSGYPRSPILSIVMSAG